MELLTRKIKARSACKVWSGMHGKRRLYVGKGKRLVALGDNPAPEQVEKITESKFFTWTRCLECGNVVERAVKLGAYKWEKWRYHREYYPICKPCLTEALRLLVESELKDS